MDPGIQNGKPVRVKYNIPIRFNLDKQGNYSTERPDQPPKGAGVVGSYEDLKSLSNLKAIPTENAPIYIVDGRKITNLEEISALKPVDIYSIRIYKDQNFIDKYGSDAKNGVLIIITKKGASDSKANIENPSKKNR